MDREALRERIVHRPNNVRFEELLRLLEAYGWEHVRTAGSHYILQRGTETFSLPYRKPTVKAAYVRRALQLTED